MLFLFLASRPDQPDILNEETNLTSPIIRLVWKEPSHKGRPKLVVVRTGSTSDVVQNQTKLLNITLERNATYEIDVTAANNQGVGGREKVTTLIVSPGK